MTTDKRGSHRLATWATAPQPPIPIASIALIPRRPAGQSAPSAYRRRYKSAPGDTRRHFRPLARRRKVALRRLCPAAAIAFIRSHRHSRVCSSLAQRLSRSYRQLQSRLTRSSHGQGKDAREHRRDRPRRLGQVDHDRPPHLQVRRHRQAHDREVREGGPGGGRRCWRFIHPLCRWARARSSTPGCWTS